MNNSGRFLVIICCTLYSLIGLDMWSQTVVRSGDIPQPMHYPFSTDSSHLTVWNGTHYVPFFIKGINFGIAVPGTSPGELAASRTDYVRWFKQIKEAGFNSIRLYTLHYPHFYDALDSFNLANPNNPLYFFQGVWLEEDISGYKGNLFSLSPVFTQEIEEDIDCVHGNRVIGHRYGKAYGTYKTDASRWLMGYIIGREIAPEEILKTDSLYPSLNSFHGTFLSIDQVTASEVFETQHLEHVLDYESEKYHLQVPVSFSNWPTLDPMKHPTETTTSEDVVSLDLSRLEFSKAKAGVFISYHAYPYYPDFISKDSLYQSCSDEEGQNSYSCYLQALRRYYPNMPLVVAEVGVPSSWGVAHYSQSGMNHGGETELQQGQYDLRLLKNIHRAGCAGGMQFSWMDEWFKRTWITDPFDFSLESRQLWHNICAAEQNFGLIGFRKKNNSLRSWQTFGADSPVRELKGSADYAFFNLQMKLKDPFSDLDTLWIALDTYDPALGERISLTGDTLKHGAEFMLRITNDAADLYVTEAYDLFGIWHKTSNVAQLYHSVPTTGKPWKLVRWKNNEGEENIQYIGHLNVNRLGLPVTSKDAILFSGDSLLVKIPWTLLQFIDPTKKKVFDDNRSTPNDVEVRVSDGILPSVHYKGKWVTPDSRFTWDDWADCRDAEEYPKESYTYLKEHLGELPGMLVAMTDTFTVLMNDVARVFPKEGVLSNDYLVEPIPSEAVLAAAPRHGMLQLLSDGSFTYVPDVDFQGTDQFTYKAVSGVMQSLASTVSLTVKPNNTKVGFIQVYPNPVKDELKVRSATMLDKLILYNAQSKKIGEYSVSGRNYTVDVSGLPQGIYLLESYAGEEVLVQKVLVSKE